MVDSQVLKSNLLGDPTAREVHVYLPPGHEQPSGRGLPLLVDLVGYSGSGLSHTNWRNFGENVPERLDRLIAEGAMPPVVAAFPDCFTRLGGNQYINSVAVGRWEDFLIDEMLPAIEQRFDCGGPGRRGVFGKSSGGYGAIVHAMRRADTWAAVACHSGDMGFELMYWGNFPRTLQALARHGLSIERFVTAFEAANKDTPADVSVIEHFSMAATYDPDPEQFLGIRLPVDLETCEVLPERWANWQAWDPLSMVDQCAENLSRLKAVYLDCGDVDQCNLVYGARRFHRALSRLGVDHVYDEFPDNHTNIDYRMDRSLPLLAHALTRS
ncbi:MAG: alpha/beta hydrolase-fold protein [Myxococcales bacterium]|nr:alpha/beta hydrolase-fold protein [Myxococcales bacterium]